MTGSRDTTTGFRDSTVDRVASALRAQAVSTPTPNGGRSPRPVSAAPTAIWIILVGAVALGVLAGSVAGLVSAW